jgi:HAD superfamily phosphoserine phosphatase-like hydrolase
MTETNVPDGTDRVAVVDLEGTLSKDANVWMDMNLSLGMTEEEDYELYKKYRDDHDFTYGDWTEELISRWEHPEDGGTPGEEYFDAFFELPEFRETAHDLVEELQEQGFYTVLLSGAPDGYTRPAAEHLGVDEHVDSVSLVYEDGEVVAADFNEYKTDKTSVLDDLDDEEVWFFGNGYNDVGMAEAADRSFMVPNKDIDYDAVADHVGSLEEHYEEVSG